MKNMQITKVPVSVIILTLNEEAHIKRAIENVIDWADEVIVLDSGSKDKTTQIVVDLGASLYHRDFDTYAKQRTYAIKEIPSKHEWVFFLDADEIITDALKLGIAEAITAHKEDGYYVKRRFYFNGQWIRYGGYYPIWILRLFQKSKATVDRDMNEHVVVTGTTGRIYADIIDENLKGISHWVAKHNRYASFEAMELLKERVHDPMAKLGGTATERKRWIRQYIWNPLMPPLIRPFAYFFYRYVVLLGFMDGQAGLIYHFLHGCYYRFLIDVKYLEMKAKLKKKK